MIMTMEKLIALHRAFEVAQAKADSAQIAREQGIRDLVASGTRQADIARELGLTRGRIAQIVTKPPTSSAS